MPRVASPMAFRGDFMAIHFICEQCGHHVRAEDAHAGRRARCAHCGHKMRVPGTRIHPPGHVPGEDHEDDVVEFRLAPIEDDPSSPRRLITGAAGSGKATGPEMASGSTESSPRLRPAEEGPRFGAASLGIPEELLADRAPIPLDPHYAPAPGISSHDDLSQARITARAKMYRRIRTILERLRSIENWLYVISLFFLMIAIAGLLVENRPLAHFGASWVLLCSVLLAALGGIEVIIKPFQYGIFGTSWKTMKKQIKHGLAAFIPLIVLILSYLFIGPIRDYFLDTAEARQANQMSAISRPTFGRGPEPTHGCRPRETRART